MIPYRVGTHLRRLFVLKLCQVCDVRSVVCDGVDVLMKKEASLWRYVEVVCVSVKLF